MDLAAELRIYKLAYRVAAVSDKGLSYSEIQRSSRNDINKWFYDQVTGLIEKQIDPIIKKRLGLLRSTLGVPIKIVDARDAYAVKADWSKKTKKPSNFDSLKRNQNVLISGTTESKVNGKIGIVKGLSKKDEKILVDVKGTKVRLSADKILSIDLNTYDDLKTNLREVLDVKGPSGKKGTYEKERNTDFYRMINYFARRVIKRNWDDSIIVDVVARLMGISLGGSSMSEPFFKRFQVFKSGSPQRFALFGALRSTIQHAAVDVLRMMTNRQKLENMTDHETLVLNSPVVLPSELEEKELMEGFIDFLIKHIKSARIFPKYRKVFLKKIGSKTLAEHVLLNMTDADSKLAKKYKVNKTLITRLKKRITTQLSFYLENLSELEKKYEPITGITDVEEDHAHAFEFDPVSGEGKTTSTFGGKIPNHAHLIIDRKMKEEFGHIHTLPFNERKFKKRRT